MSAFSPTSFRSARWLRTAHLLAQAILVLTLVGGLNYLATFHSWRFDLSRHNRHSLSPETRSYLRELPAPVKIIVTLTDSDDNDSIAQAYRDVRSLLRDYAEASAANPKAPVTVEYVDVYQNRAAAQKNGIDQPNLILVTSGDKKRSVGLTELYKIKNQEKVGFLGEQAFTAAILDVTRPGRQQIFFLTGHGEMDLTDTDPSRGLSLLRSELELRNFELRPFNLISDDRAQLRDAALLVIAGPQGSFSAEEQELLRRTLSTQAGRVLALLPPAVPAGLDDLLFDWGVLADDVLILDEGPDGRSDTGDLILYPTASAHPVVDFLSTNKIPLRFGPARSVRADLGRNPDPGLDVVPLLATSATAWGERAYRQAGTPVFDAATDLAPRLAVGTASKRVIAGGNLPFSIRGGRLVVFVGADWAANGRLAASGNLSLILASINWLVDRDTQLTLPPRPIERFQLSLTTAQLSRLRLTLLFALPAIAAFLGLVVAWSRRR
jgi:hypothetical protein